jgi:lipopolysaccharide export system protein LptA
VVVNPPAFPTPPPDAATTRPVGTLNRSGEALTLGSGKLPPGESPHVRFYDEKTGDLKYDFQAEHWEYVSESVLAMKHPKAKVLLPGGQLADVKADEGEIVVQRAQKSNLDPKRGWFRGNVQIFVDRTTTKWRKEHPEIADPIHHPETLVKIWLDDVRFDMDLAELHSEGPVRVESVDGLIEGRGLKLVWDEVSRRITELRIFEGQRAELRGADLGQFAMPGEQPVSGDQQDRPDAGASPISALAESSGAPSGEQRPAENEQTDELGFVSVEGGPPKPAEDRIDTYTIRFRDQVVAEQHEGARVVGRLEAALLEVLFDVGRAERSALQHAPGSRQATTTAPVARTTPRQPATSPAREKNATKEPGSVVLHWTGEVVVLPEDAGQPQTRPARTGKAERFWIVATGNPVRITSDRTGGATCQRLEYHHESKEAWLTGRPDEWVVLQTGPERALHVEKIHYDGKGRATIDGPGYMEGVGSAGSDEADLPECMRKPKAAGAQPEKAPRRLAWQGSARIEFAIAEWQAPDDSGKVATTRGEYLKHAVFEGGVEVHESDRVMSAEHVDVTFRPPTTPGGDSMESIVADVIHARGAVRMVSAQEEVSCDELIVQMEMGEDGRALARSGKATGNVMARQGSMEIRARDELLITLGSVPDPVTPQQRAELMARSRDCDYGPESPEWQRIEARLRTRRKQVITAMTAMGDVRVRDPQENLDLSADALDCGFSEEGRITQASILGDDQRPASVDSGDFYIRGPRVHLDMRTQSAEVPGGGLLRFFTDQDLDGGPLRKPVPVVVSWKDRMLLEGENNLGTFSGAVRCRSENSILNCRTLSIRFEDVIAPEAPAGADAGADPLWIVGPLLRQARREQPQKGMDRLAGQIAKRPVHLHAIGEATIETKAYDQPVRPGGAVSRFLSELLPDAMQRPTTRPADGSQRLVSRARVEGPQIAIDLVQEHLVVEGSGYLLVEDYRLPEKRQASARRSSGVGLVDSPDTLAGDGPSQTLFTWQNSMSFLNGRNVAVFDHRVVMDHRTGDQMAMSRELAAALHVDPAKLAQLKSRKVDLTTDHLLVEFARDAEAPQAGPSPLSRATRLKLFDAMGRVRIQTEGRSIEGTSVTYREDSGILRATGSAQSPPQILAVDEKTGQVTAARGDWVEWNVRTKKLTVKQPRIMAPTGG